MTTTQPAFDTAQSADRRPRLLRAAARARRAEIDAVRRAAAEAVRPDTDVRAAVAAAARRSVPRWHFEMLNDAERTDALVKSVAAAVRPGDHVLDIGAGTGLLAMVAAQSGAARVTTCEGNPLLAEIARQVVDAHGYSDVVTVLPRWSTALDAERDLGGRVDLVVSEIVDCGLIGEGLLPSVRHAREHLLAPDGRMVPHAARILGRLVESEAAAGLNRVHTVAGFDLSLLNLAATTGHFPLRTATRPHRMLSPTVEVAAFDLTADPLTDAVAHLAVDPSRTGTAHGLVAWFELELGSGVVLRNAPDNTTSHWAQAFVAFDEPVPVRAGVPVAVDVAWRDGGLFATPRP